MTANTLRLEAHGRDGGTVVGTIRGTGLLRASRPFAEGAAARVVVAHLGPGMVRGDAFATSGRVARGGHLIVAGQMATRVLSGPDVVTNAASWVVESDARLQLVAEPTLVAAGASYDARLTVTLEPGACLIVTELVRREPGAALRVATVVRRAQRAACIDVLRLDRHDPEGAAIGTLAIFAPAAADRVSALDRIADRWCGAGTADGIPSDADAEPAAGTGVRIGIGVLRDGDVLVRAIGASTWAVREALDALRGAALRTFSPAGTGCEPGASAV